MKELTGREKALISRGYSINDVLSFSRVSETEIKASAAKIFLELIKDVLPADNPACYYIGSQPGSGKSTLIRQIKLGRLGSQFVNIAMDDYRSFHPRYVELENLIARHWEGREENPDDMPGSDIADFTQGFAGRVTDHLELMVSAGEKKYNILYEWAMRSAQEPLNSMQRLKACGYTINVNFIAVNKAVSLDACRQRSIIMNSKGRVIRAIPDAFHSLSIERIPYACNEIYSKGHELIDRFYITDRRGEVLWEKGDAGFPGDFLRKIFENGPSDVENADRCSEEAYEQESKGFTMK